MEDELIIGEQPKAYISPVADLMVTPNNPPWNVWTSLGVWVLSVIFIFAVPMVFLLPYLISSGVNFRDHEELNNFIFSDQTAIILQLAPIFLAHILTVALGWAVVTRLNRYSFFETLGWRMNGFRVWHAVVITVGFFVVTVIMTKIFGRVDNDFERLIDNSRAALYLVALFATFTAPLVEELVYRGIVFSAFQRRFGLSATIIFVTLLFTVVHVPQYSQNSHPDLASIFSLLLLSLTLTLIRAGTGNLLPCIVLHTVFNGTQSLLLIVQQNFDTTAPTPDPTGWIFHFLK